MRLAPRRLSAKRSSRPLLGMIRNCVNSIRPLRDSREGFVFSSCTAAGVGHDLPAEKLARQGPTGDARALSSTALFAKGSPSMTCCLQPAASDVLPTQVDVRSRLTRQLKLNIPAPRLRDGHGDRGAHGDRHGADRRARRHPSQSLAAGAGRSGAPGEEVRVRDGGEPDHHLPRRDARRRLRADEAARHFGSARRRARPREARRASSSASSPTAMCASPRTRASPSPS